MTTVEAVTITGDDTQNVIGNTVSHDLVVNQIRYVRERRSMSLADGEIADRVAEYVPALNHRDIVERLRLGRAVALCGPRGAGVATTAIAALRELRPRLEIRRLTTGEDDVEEIRSADAVGYLVRAGDEDASRLRTCAEAVWASGGYLLVVGTEADHRGDFADVLPPVPVRPPDAITVYRRRLARKGLGETAWPGWPGAADLLKDGSPGDACRLADIVRAVVRTGGDEREVERAYRGWEEQLREWFGGHPEPRDRTLLIAAATIAPADETSVYGAALSLARQLAVKVEGGGLVWCPSTGLGELIGAGADGGRLAFRRQGYRESVLRFVWRDYPLARNELLGWLAALPADGAVVLDPALRNRVAEVFADLAAEHGSAERILRAAHDWAVREEEADLAYVALARACLHPVVGGRVRTRLYEWSRERRLPQTLKLTIVRVGQVLGGTYPSIAMTRLKHLATFGNEQVRAEVADVAAELAQDHHDVVFEAALGWCGAAAGLSSERDGGRLADVALRVLLDLLARRPEGARPVGAVLDAIERLAGCGGGVRRPALRAALELGARHRAAVVRAALAWSDDLHADPFSRAPERALFGSALFLRLARVQGADGLAVVLTGPDAVDPVGCVSAWHAALAMPPPDGAGVDDAARLWLETALARPDLRRGVLECLIWAAHRDPALRRRVVGIVRTWGNLRADVEGVRGVREEVVAELLLPEWQRVVFKVWVKVRRLVVRDG
ncbi:hypothetical protein E1293_43335 [Actinomadura darangshiensis]|uniref:Uncharacterized protein n=1 Tax=Actinomadura darangshiensis TaxID=705336 RepID=A0A4R4ZYR3_9ACTN|nr:hypothetical protein [Actinomadura darangshiensis]TDD63319.1 hypothetical protein E1293_43335 [Actinomadura darangshiensis]